jgi:hypothetical protein
MRPTCGACAQQHRPVVELVSYFVQDTVAGGVVVVVSRLQDISAEEQGISSTNVGFGMTYSISHDCGCVCACRFQRYRVVISSDLVDCGYV